jgi:hypothetical protein
MDEQRKQQELLAELESIKALLDYDSSIDDVFLNPHLQRSTSDRNLLAQTSNLPLRIPTLDKVVFEDELAQDDDDPRLNTPRPAVHDFLSSRQSRLKQDPLERHKSGAESEASNDKSTTLAATYSDADRPRTVYNYIHSSSDSPPKSTRDYSRDNTLDPSFENPISDAGENPFLPQHIRERLTKPVDLEAILAHDANKRFLLPPIIKTTVDETLLGEHRFLNKAKPDSNDAQVVKATLKAASDWMEPRASSDTKMSLLIDELVAQYLPEIEAKLRLQLRQALIATPPKQ